MIVVILNSILLGFGLAMDAFSVSLANGLNEPHMKSSRMSLIAGTFAAFQAVMPLIGYFVVKTAASIFDVLEHYIPVIALIVLSFIGIKMIIDGAHGKASEEAAKPVTFSNLIVQGIATSIDALSVGFTIAAYSIIEASLSAVIIGVVTFVICFIGLFFGKKLGMKLADKASIFGGAILIAIGLEIFITSFFK